MAAQELHFEYGAHGKPFLAEPEYSSLRFNVSHSLDVALIAVAYEREVGVDIEHVHTDIAVKEIAKTVLSGPEKHALSRFVDESKRTACLQLWTRKEAYVKADGRGMSLPLKHVDVSVPADRVAVLNNATGKSKVSMRWMLETLAVGPDYVAALAAEGQDWQLTCWQWEDNERAI
jgi:4'-phosphopantetheinyl transferase